MWKAIIGSSTGKSVETVKADIDDDWDTDPDFVNNVSEKEQRWGSKTVAGSGRVESIE